MSFCLVFKYHGVIHDEQKTIYCREHKINGKASGAWDLTLPLFAFLGAAFRVLGQKISHRFRPRRKVSHFLGLA